VPKMETGCEAWAMLPDTKVPKMETGCEA